MRGDCDRFPLNSGKFRLISAVGVVVVLAGLATIGVAPPAQALPSFARQTGQPCGTCHTDFPALTPFGRRFKLLGYTTGGGKFRTTPFASRPDDAGAAADKLRNFAKAMDSGKDESDKPWVPPVSMMAIAGYTHTQASLAPPTAPYSDNDNVVLANPFSAFWGGAVTEHIGAFAQVTYAPPGPGDFANQFGHTWTWDNTDIRYANETSIGFLDVIYGISANNNPTVQDLWNTTPAWAFPYTASNIAPTPAAATLLEGTFAAHVGGVGAYVYLNDMLYLEATAYKTLGFKQQNAVGTNPFDAPGLFEGAAPYWRAALEPHWGNNYLMVGTFGMMADVHPWIDSSFALGTTGTFPQTDRYTDVGFDSQYQYQGDNYWFTLRGSYIREFQNLTASFSNGLSANQNNLLSSLRLQAALALGGDNRFVFTGQYFDIQGTPDPILYAGLASGISPNSNGWIAELAYIPFGTSPAPGWPWFNARIALDYIVYEKFDGTKQGASGNNTLFLSLWLAM
jgi:hypothetical protein